MGFMNGCGAVTFWRWRSAGATARLAGFFDVVFGERAYDSTADGSEEAVASLLANVGAGSTAAQGSKDTTFTFLRSTWILHLLTGRV